MTLITSKAVKPLRKLRKLLKEISADPRPEEVHALRTQTRRLEATFNALALDRYPEAKQLLKMMAPVRKAAGRVRDMDVLIGHVLGMQKGHSEESLVRLIEHLGKLRVKHARQLCKVIGARQEKAREALKSCARIMQDTLGNGAEAEQSPAALQVAAAELGHWPRLTAANLHPFRIKAKELKYMLDLNKNGPKIRMRALSRVKDTAGDWHDCVELYQIADKVLDPKLDRELLRDLADFSKKKLTEALAASNSLRREGFDHIAN